MEVGGRGWLVAPGVGGWGKVLAGLHWGLGEGFWLVAPGGWGGEGLGLWFVEGGVSVCGGVRGRQV